MAVLPVHRLVSVVLGALLCVAAGIARGYSLTPDDQSVPPSFDDPAVRILVGQQPLPLTFVLVSQDNDWAPWPSALPRLAPPAGRFSPAPAEHGVRLWLPVTDADRSPFRLTQAYVHLGQPAWNDADHRVRPGAGFVMQLGRAPGHLQQLALGSVFRLDMGAGSQVTLRLRGGRLGVQYRVHFSL